MTPNFEAFADRIRDLRPRGRITWRIGFMKKILTFIMAATLTVVSVGCGPFYAKPGGTRQEYERDFQDCFDRAVEAGPPMAVNVLAALFLAPATVVIAQKRDARVRDCMQARGYTHA
jgi:hypothetical protein